MKTIEQFNDRMVEIEQALALLNVNAAPLRKELSEIDRQRGILNREKDEIKAQIQALKKAPRVSDHAVLRFLERKHGFDFETVRKSLLTPAVIQAMSVGAEGVRIEGGTLKISDKCVTTFIGSSAKSKPKKDRRQLVEE